MAAAGTAVPGTLNLLSFQPQKLLGCVCMCAEQIYARNIEIALLSSTFYCQVSALCCAGGEQNLIMLDRTIHKPTPAGTVGWAGSTFGPLHKSRIGEHEFEALMRTLDNLVNKNHPEQTRVSQSAH